MAEASVFVGANFVFRAPEGREDIGDLWTFRQPDGPCNVSCWQLTADELAEINRTGQVFLSIASGPVFYPAFVGSEESVRQLVVDSGKVWERSAPP